MCCVCGRGGAKKKERETEKKEYDVKKEFKSHFCTLFQNRKKKKGRAIIILKKTSSANEPTNPTTLSYPSNTSMMHSVVGIHNYTPS